MTESELNEAIDKILKIRSWDRNEIPHVLTPESTPEAVAAAVMATCLGREMPVDGRQLKLRYVIVLLKDLDSCWQKVVNICNAKEKDCLTTKKVKR